jgi:ribosomal protein S18 acetylase RimI-like enzyme
MPPEWTLRQGRENDIRAMYLLDLVCFDEPFRFDQRSMRRFALQVGALVVVAESDTKLAGFVVVHLVRKAKRTVGYVVTVDVAREFRRRGLARTLIAEVERQAAQAGAAEMALHVHTGNEAAIAFYERSGYSRGIACKSFYGDRLDGWTYVKQLTGTSPRR